MKTPSRARIGVKIESDGSLRWADQTVKMGGSSGPGEGHFDLGPRSGAAWACPQVPRWSASGPLIRRIRGTTLGPGREYGVAYRDLQVVATGITVLHYQAFPYYINGYHSVIGVPTILYYRIYILPLYIR